MAKTTPHKANTRGHADHGWLDTWHTFSFAGYYDKDRVHFGALRVLNDDTVAPGTGFGRHPHDNMEIVSIPLSGELRHQDSMGHVQVLRPGDVQVMSAGTGLTHSEENDSDENALKFLQIWVIPNKRNVAPRYEQVTIDEAKQRNAFQQLVSPDPGDEGSWIHQDAWFHLGVFDAGISQSYRLKQTGNGLYAFVISGGAVVEAQDLSPRDGIGIEDANEVSLSFTEPETRLLLIEVPMI
jgi:quercetin 2,3-dioxygenase